MERFELAVSAPSDAAGARRSDPASIYLSRLAPSGRRTMHAALHKIAALASGGRADAHELPWEQWRNVHTQALRAELAERYAPATVNKHLSALRGVLEACFDLELMSAEDYQRAVRAKRVSAHRLPAGHALTAAELRALFSACDDGRNAGARDAALLAVLYGCGLRRSEAVGLDVDDVDASTGLVRVRQGKGRKDRIVWAAGGTLQALRRWLQARGDEPVPLFLPVNKAGQVVHRRLTGQAVLHICQRRAQQAGIGAFSPHDLRRTFIGDLLDRGPDIATVQQLAGHANGGATRARASRRARGCTTRPPSRAGDAGRSDGRRQGEAFGLTVDRSGLRPPSPRPILRVDRQLVSLSRQDPYLGPPKRKASRRDLPLPRVALEALAAHLAAFPPSPQPIRVLDVAGREMIEEVDLVFTTAAGKPIRRNAFSHHWRAAAKAADVEGATFHDCATSTRRCSSATVSR